MKQLVKNPDGTFAKGNTTGGRKGIDPEIKKLIASFTEDAVRTLYQIMMNDKTNARDRLVAANSILDRALGRAPTTTQMEEEIQREGTSGTFKITFVSSDDSNTDVSET